MQNSHVTAQMLLFFSAQNKSHHVSWQVISVCHFASVDVCDVTDADADSCLPFMRIFASSSAVRSRRCSMRGLATNT